ncbi:hypothetical protein ABW21_db0203613 [Orbilia brochopaga]|nr:hypothetical protein ABW21_db0203613 [Drechslerella brochopaga]
MPSDINNTINPSEDSKAAPPSDTYNGPLSYMMCEVTAFPAGGMMAETTKNTDEGEEARPQKTDVDTTLFRSSPESKFRGGLLPDIQALLPQNRTPRNRWTVRDYSCILSGLYLVWQAAIRAKTDSFILATLCGLGLFQLSLIHAYVFFWLFTAVQDDKPAPVYCTYPHTSILYAQELVF